MYIRNGFFHGGEPGGLLKVRQVQVLPDKMLLILFSNGETRLFDAAILEGPAYEALQDDKVFSEPEIEHGIVTWLQGEIDCSPEYMYWHSCEYSEVV